MINLNSFTPSSRLESLLSKDTFKKEIRSTVLLTDSEALLKKKSIVGVLGKAALIHGESGWTAALLCPSDSFKINKSWPDINTPSAFTLGRDCFGDALRSLNTVGKTKNLDVQVHSKSKDFLNGVIVGIELSFYTFKNPLGNFESVVVHWNDKVLKFSEISSFAQMGAATNWARHLVNLPPNVLNPEMYAQTLKTAFGKLSGVKVEIWNEKKLKSENCNLHLAVGEGALHKPRLVILRYRPKGAKNKKPIALVGKGITFDTGGLDIKPSQGMRLMKKDMGGSAAVIGTLYYAAKTKMPLNVDVYVALAENAVSAAAFRPSDIVTARSGKTIEIHNTDAEGRLVLADALDVAQTQSASNQPSEIVDVATLTGAIKVGLGSAIAGLFYNDSKLGSELFQHFHGMGDDAWPMPLFQKYRPAMASNFADMTNAVDGFGGAITAALFLESFIQKDIPWAHLDIYAWKDGAQGPFMEAGGSGQAVQGLSQWLLSKVN